MGYSRSENTCGLSVLFLEPLLCRLYGIYCWACGKLINETRLLVRARGEELFWMVFLYNTMCWDFLGIFKGRATGYIVMPVKYSSTHNK